MPALLDLLLLPAVAIHLYNIKRLDVKPLLFRTILLINAHHSLQLSSLPEGIPEKKSVRRCSRCITQVSSDISRHPEDGSEEQFPSEYRPEVAESGWSGLPLLVGELAVCEKYYYEFCYFTGSYQYLWSS